jgi:Fe-S-cluster-containing dehydrogenase component
MIHLEFVNRAETVQTTPQICMHCDIPTCALVCPADAIKRTPDGVVQTSLKPRCVGCGNCVLACPFGVPKYEGEADQMMKCDMCYDRTSVGKRPMCATVCPSEALYFGSKEEWDRRRRGKAVNKFKFGNQNVRTKVFLVMPEEAPERIDVKVSDIVRRPRRQESASFDATNVWGKGDKVEATI